MAQDYFHLQIYTQNLATIIQRPVIDYTLGPFGEQELLILQSLEIVSLDKSPNMWGRGCLVKPFTM